ncbi:MAG: YceI family protein [Helicobacter sp.]|nr:YceI family protein [Helicobacter sp.]
MKKVFLGILSVFFGLGLSFAKSYSIDYTHTASDFEVKHFTITKVRGTFDKIEAKVDAENDGTINSIEGIINSDTLDTRNADRDKHMKSEDFLSTKNYKTITFKSTKITDDKVYGILTIKGISKQIELDLTKDKIAHPRTGRAVYALELNGKINRLDFNVGKSISNAVISNEVKLHVIIEAYE